MTAITLYCVESCTVIAHMVKCSGIDQLCSWSGGCHECCCIFSYLDQVTSSCSSEWPRWCACIDFVVLNLGTFKVDAVGLDVSLELTVVGFLMVDFEGLWIAVVRVVFTVFSPLTCFCGMVVHFSVSIFVFQVYISLSASLSAMTVAGISNARG